MPEEELPSKYVSGCTICQLQLKSDTYFINPVDQYDLIIILDYD